MSNAVTKLIQKYVRAPPSINREPDEWAAIAKQQDQLAVKEDTEKQLAEAQRRRQYRQELEKQINQRPIEYEAPYKTGLTIQSKSDNDIRRAQIIRKETDLDNRSQMNLKIAEQRQKLNEEKQRITAFDAVQNKLAESRENQKRYELQRKMQEVKQFNLQVATEKRGRREEMAGSTSLETIDSYENIRQKKLQYFRRQQEMVARSFQVPRFADEERSLATYVQQQEDEYRRGEIAKKMQVDQAKSDLLSGLKNQLHERKFRQNEERSSERAFGDVASRQAEADLKSLRMEAQSRRQQQLEYQKALDSQLNERNSVSKSSMNDLERKINAKYIQNPLQNSKSGMSLRAKSLERQKPAPGLLQSYERSHTPFQALKQNLNNRSFESMKKPLVSSGIKIIS